MICSHCGVILDEYTGGTTINEDKYCLDCADELFATCHFCGDVVSKERADYVEDVWVCEDCQREHTRICSNCGNEILSESAYYDCNGEAVCDICCYNYYVECANCDDLVRRDDAVYGASGDAYCCEDCLDRCDDYEDDNCNIHDYTYKPDLNFSNQEKRIEDLHIGFELEVDCGYNDDETAYTIIDGNDRLYCKTDGSLRDNGFEIVSHPLNWNEFSTTDWKKLMIKPCLGNGYKSHDTETCGLHFHADRKFLTQEAITKLQIFINNNYDTIMKISRRNNGKSTWCRCDEYFCRYVADGSNPVDINSLAHAPSSSRETRYLALNLQNYNTVEFRFFRGTLNYDTFMLSGKFIYEICKIAKEISLEDAFVFSKWYDMLSENVRQFIDNNGKRTKYIEAEEVEV